MGIFSAVPLVLEARLYVGCGRMVRNFSDVKTCQRLFDPEFEFDDERDF